MCIRDRSCSVIHNHSSPLHKRTFSLFINAFSVLLRRDVYKRQPDTGAVIVEVEQPNDEQVGSLTLTKTGEQPVEVK